AKKYQKYHRAAIYVAAWFAPFAVVAAILELASEKTQWIPFLPCEKWLQIIEVSAALIAVGSVFVGHIGKFKEKWLFFRHQAEKCRLLRYYFLTHPLLWQENQDPKQWIRAGLEEIALMREENAVEKTVCSALPHGPFDGIQCRVPRQVLENLT